MREEIIYQWALTRIRGIGPATTRLLIERFGHAKAVFEADESMLLRLKLSPQAIQQILHFTGQNELRRQLLSMEKNGIRLLFFTDPAYPQRLLSVPDAPPLLFYKGKADLNAAKILAVIGTRTPSSYGRDMTNRLIAQLAPFPILILSGMALGIDGYAHQAALQFQLPTIGVLGHGLYTIYPPEHTALAQSVLKADGGLLTAYEPGVPVEKHNFPQRNKILAGCCDALLVVESALNGGSMLSVQHAIEFNKPVFAVPGRVSDPKSRGCNKLIQQDKARMVGNGADILTAMGWGWSVNGPGIQPALPFKNDSAHRSLLLNLMKENTSLSLDELSIHSKLDIGSLSITLLHMELDGLICHLPGKRYQLRA